MDLNFQAVVSRVCFGSLTSSVEDKLLGTYWGCTFPVGLVFLFLKQCLMQVKPHSTAVSSFPPKGDGCFSSAMFIQPYHSVDLGMYIAVLYGRVYLGDNDPFCQKYCPF